MTILSSLNLTTFLLTFLVGIAGLCLFIIFGIYLPDANKFEDKKIVALKSRIKKFP